MTRYANNVNDQFGRPIQGAQVHVYTRSEQLVTLTGDLGEPLANPVTTDSSGGFSFNAPDGVYILDIWLNGRRLYRDNNVEVGQGPALPVEIVVALADPGRAALVGAAGGGSVQDRLNALASADATLAAADTALDTRLDAIEVVTPTGEPASRTLQTALWGSQEGRSRLEVYSGGPQTVRLLGTTFCMQGFRRFGEYEFPSGPRFPVTGGGASINLGAAGTIPGLTTPVLPNWYNIWAVANAGNAACSFRATPTFLVKSRAGNVLTLGRCGEDLARKDAALGTSAGITDATYGYANNALAGTRVMILSQGLSFTNRIATITANTATTITLDDATGLGPLDMICPWPTGWTYARWLGDVYLETGAFPAGELRNMYDDGRVCQGRMVDLMFYIGPGYLDGVILQSAAKPVFLQGFISPHAVSVTVYETVAISTASLGFALTFWDNDGSRHVTKEVLYRKLRDTTESIVDQPTKMNFYQSQRYWIWNRDQNLAVNPNELNASKSGVKQQVIGWEIP